jgi:hypothetical protein
MMPEYDDTVSLLGTIGASLLGGFLCVAVTLVAVALLI